MKLKTVIDVMRRCLSPDIPKHEAASQGMPPSPCGEDRAHYQAMSAKILALPALPRKTIVRPPGTRIDEC